MTIIETEAGQRLKIQTFVGEHRARFEIDEPDGATRYLELTRNPSDWSTWTVTTNIPGEQTRGIRATRSQALVYFASVVGGEITRALEAS